MKQTLNLTKILLKNSFNKNNNDGNSKKKKVSMTILLTFAILYLAGVMGFLSHELINSLKEINQEQVFLSLCLMASIGITLIRTILTSLNVLYFSKDIEFLLPLPIKPVKIVLAKFNVMLVSEYITEFITFIIPFAVYGYMMQVSLSFYIYSILVFLFLPIIPMLIGILLIVIIMKFTKFLNNKDIVQYLSVLLTITLVIGIQFISNSSNEVTNFMLANKMLEINGLAKTFSEYFFTLKQANNVIFNIGNIEAIKNIILLGIESVLAYIVVAYGVSKIYIDSAIKSTASGIKSRVKKIKNKTFVQKKVGLTYIQKEFKNLFRNPIFFLQCVLPVILLPIIFAIPLYNSFSSFTAEQANAMNQAFSEVLKNSMGMGIILVIINFLYMFNYISVTAISRDGQNATFMKYIPVKLHTQCKYKALPSIILNFMPLLLVIGVILYFAKDVLWATILEIFIVGAVYNILISYISIFIDLQKPKLHWTSEYSVVKQNMNMLYETILAFFIMGIIIGIAAYIENLHILTSVLLGIAILVLILYEVFLRKYSRQIFRKIN